MTLREAISQGGAELADSGSMHAKLDAETLLLFAMGREGDRAFLLTHAAEMLDAAIAAHYRGLILQRASGKPMQYITGHQEFWGLDLQVNADVLIPRPETEHSVEAVLRLVAERAAPRILDVGTGSGCIAIAIAHALPHAEVTGVDLSAAALYVAQANGERNDVAVRWRESDLLSAVPGEQFDVIVSNPPYVAADHPETAQRQVRDFEPSLALFGGADGMQIYVRLILQAHTQLKEGGHLVLEIGYSLEDKVCALLLPSHWSDVETITDLQGIPRVIAARRIVPGIAP